MKRPREVLRGLLAPWRASAELRAQAESVAALRAELAGMEQRLQRQTGELRRELAASRTPPPFGCPMPDGTTLVQSIYGNRYFIDPLDRVTGPEIILRRVWEPDISNLLASAAHRDLVFVDVGANFGYFTCLMGGRIGRGGRGRVHAIEPNPACVALLRRNVEINWSMCRIEIFEGAVGDQSGRLKLYVPQDHSANGYLGDAHNRDWTNFPSVEVEVRPLDAVAAPDQSVDLMKIDVEGHEYAALAGARQVIARSENLDIVMEWSTGQMVRAGYAPNRLPPLFRELQLRPYRLAPSFAADALRGRELSDEALLAIDYDNIVLTRRTF